LWVVIFRSSFASGASSRILWDKPDPFGRGLLLSSLLDHCRLSRGSLVLIAVDVKGKEAFSSHFPTRGQSIQITTVNSKSRLGVLMVGVIKEVGAFPSA